MKRLLFFYSFVLLSNQLLGVFDPIPVEHSGARIDPTHNNPTGLTPAEIAAERAKTTQAVAQRAAQEAALRKIQNEQVQKVQQEKSPVNSGKKTPSKSIDSSLGKSTGAKPSESSQTQSKGTTKSPSNTATQVTQPVVSELTFASVLENGKPTTIQSTVAQFIDDAQTMTAAELATSYVTNTGLMTDTQKIGALAASLLDGIYQISSASPDVSPSYLADMQDVFKTICQENSSIIVAQPVVAAVQNALSSYVSDLQQISEQVSSTVTTFSSQAKNAKMANAVLIQQLYDVASQIDNLQTDFLNKQTAFEAIAALVQDSYQSNSTMKTQINLLEQQINTLEQQIVPSSITALSQIFAWKSVGLLDMYANKLQNGTMTPADFSTLFSLQLDSGLGKLPGESDDGFIQRMMKKASDAAYDAALDFIKEKIKVLLKKWFGRVLTLNIISDCSESIFSVVKAQAQLQLMVALTKIAQANVNNPGARVAQSALIQTMQDQVDELQKENDNNVGDEEGICIWAVTMRSNLKVQLTQFSTQLTTLQQQLPTTPLSDSSSSQNKKTVGTVLAQGAKNVSKLSTSKSGRKVLKGSAKEAAINLAQKVVSP